MEQAHGLNGSYLASLRICDVVYYPEYFNHWDCVEKL